MDVKNIKKIKKNLKRWKILNCAMKEDEGIGVMVFNPTLKIETWVPKKHAERLLTSTQTRGKRYEQRRILFHNHPPSKECTTDYPTLSDIFTTLAHDFPYHVIFNSDGFFILEKIRSREPISDDVWLEKGIQLENRFCDSKRKTRPERVAELYNQIFKSRGLHFRYCRW